MLEVPIVVKACPSLTIPVPIAAQALSLPPATTTVSVDNPHFSAIFGKRFPTTSGDSYTSPRSSLSTFRKQKRKMYHFMTR